MGGGAGETDQASPRSPEPRTTAPPEPESSEPTYVETEACREDAQTAVNILELALQDADVRDVPGRLRMLPDAVALCSGTLSHAVNAACDNIGDAVDAALAGRSLGNRLGKVTSPTPGRSRGPRGSGPIAGPSDLAG